MPPCGPTNTGRPFSELVAIFQKYLKGPTYLSLSDKVFLSNCNGLTLKEYCLVCKYICSIEHTKKDSICSCPLMIQAATMVLNEGIIKLSTVYVTYRSSNAKRRLLRMPLVAIVKGEKERECVRYAVYKCSGLTQTQARNHFGLENMEARAFTVESCIKEAKEITNELDHIVSDQCQALLDCYGLTSIDEQELLMGDSDESDYDDDFVDNIEELLSSIPQVESTPNDDMLMKTLVDCDYNWFEFVEQLERQWP